MVKVKAYQSFEDEWIEFDVIAELKWLGESNPLSFLKNHVYYCVGVEHNWLRIIDETEEDYLWKPYAEDWEVIADYSPGKKVTGLLNKSKGV